MDEHYNGILDMFKTKAKKQYKIYEDYLNKAEELLNYSLNYSSKVSELINLLMENAFLRNKFEIKEYFDSLENFEETENIEMILDRFTKSDFLKKKNLFPEIKQKIGTNLKINFSDLQTIYEKFLEEERVEVKFSNSRIEQGPGSSMPSEIMENDTKFQILYRNLIDSISQFTVLLVKNFYESFNKDSLMEISTVLKTLIRTIKSYLFRVKEQLINTSIDTDIGDFSLQNITNYNQEVVVLNKKLDLLEKIEYDKVLDLKEKNSKLRLIKNHLDSLKLENENLSKLTNDNNFYFSEQNEIILSYERSIKDKQLFIQTKKLEIKALKDEAEDKNSQLEILLLEIIEKQNEIHQFEILNHDSTRQIRELGVKLDITKADLLEVKKKEGKKKLKLEEKNLELNRLTEIIAKVEEEILNIQKTKEMDLQLEFNKLENDFQNKIRQKVRNELDLELDLRKKNLF